MCIKFFSGEEKITKGNDENVKDIGIFLRLVIFYQVENGTLSLE